METTRDEELFELDIDYPSFTLRELAREKEEMITPEANLWGAVVNQAIDDLFYNKRGGAPSTQPKLDARRIRQSAYSFLFNNAPMFQRHRKFVFEAVGINTDIDLRKLRQRADAFELTCK